MWIHVCSFDSIPLVHLYGVMIIKCGFYNNNIVLETEITEGDISINSLFIQDCFSYPGFFFIPECQLQYPVLDFIGEICLGR